MSFSLIEDDDSLWDDEPLDFANPQNLEPSSDDSLKKKLSLAKLRDRDAPFWAQRTPVHSNPNKRIEEREYNRYIAKKYYPKMSDPKRPMNSEDRKTLLDIYAKQLYPRTSLSAARKSEIIAKKGERGTRPLMPASLLTQEGAPAAQENIINKSLDTGSSDYQYKYKQQADVHFPWKRKRL